MAVALIAGVATAIAAGGLPAHAANSSITAEPTDSWNPNTVTITAGDSVSWSNGGGFHDVCVLKPGGSGDTCKNNPDAVFRNGDPNSDWSSYTNSFTFTEPGTYTFFCEAHKSLGMTGTITVQAASTGTSTAPPTEPQPSYPTMTPTQTTPTTSTDTTPPRFVGKPRRRASRTSIVLDLKSSEPAKLRATVYRRPPLQPRRRSNGRGPRRPRRREALATSKRVAEERQLPRGDAADRRRGQSVGSDIDRLQGRLN